AEAALRGIDLILEQGLSAYAVALPGGEDPDSYVREQGGEAFQEYVKKQRQDFATFMYGLARRAGRLDTPEGQAETMHTVVASVARIPDPLKQETFLRRASEVLDVPDMQLRPVLSQLLRKQQQRARRDAQREHVAAEMDAGQHAPAPSQETGESVQAQAPPEGAYREPLPQEKILIRLMLEHSTSMMEFILGHMAMDEFTAGPSREIVQILLEMYQNEAVDTRRFFDGSLDAAVQSLAAEVLVDRYEPSENWQNKNIPVPRINEDPHKAATSAMRLLKLHRVDAAIKRQKEKMYHASQEEGDLRALQTEMMQLHDLRKQIERLDFLQWHNS
ncbi:MAG: DNA primase, partial [Rhodothermales bacterium]